MNEKEIKAEDSTLLQLAKYVKIPSTVLLTKGDLDDLLMVLMTIEEVTGISPYLYMDMKLRTRSYVRLRQISAYIIRRFTGLSFKEVGMLQGHRDHSTIIHSCKKAEEWVNGAGGWEYERKIIEKIVERHGEKCKDSI